MALANLCHNLLLDSYQRNLDDSVQQSELHCDAEYPLPSGVGGSSDTVH